MSNKSFEEWRDKEAERSFKEDYIKKCEGNLPGPSSLYEHGYCAGADKVHKDSMEMINVLLEAIVKVQDTVDSVIKEIGVTE